MIGLTDGKGQPEICDIWFAAVNASDCLTFLKEVVLFEKPVHAGNDGIVSTGKFLDPSIVGLVEVEVVRAGGRAVDYYLLAVHEKY